MTSWTNLSVAFRRSQYLECTRIFHSPIRVTVSNSAFRNCTPSNLVPVSGVQRFERTVIHDKRTRSPPSFLVPILRQCFVSDQTRPGILLSDVDMYTLHGSRQENSTVLEGDSRQECHPSRVPCGTWISFAIYGVWRSCVAYKKPTTQSAMDMTLNANKRSVMRTCVPQSHKRPLL